MSKLVNELIKEHSVIFETLNEVKALGIGSKEGQNTLLAVKSGLLAHLNKEDEQLYPILNNAAASDANLSRSLDLFAKDMDEISNVAMEFFNKHSTGGSGLEFSKDFGGLFATLHQRMRKEEGILYQKYDKLEQ